MNPIKGLHHLTAVAGNPQANIDFYQSVLGQRLVKRTVNFDDPGTYHFYFGDESGSPGTILTFFPWAHVKRGVTGNGESAAVAYSIPPASVGYWRQRLAAHGLIVGQPQERFGAEVIPFQDRDGMPLELIADDRRLAVHHWADGPVPAEHALRGFHSTTLWLDQMDGAETVLTDHMGYRVVGREGARTRLAAQDGEPGSFIDLLHRPGQPRGRFGAGSVHHVAFRAADDAEQLEYLAALAAAGYGVTSVQDRQYFHSIYYRIPGGVLFEIATDPPGFTFDETLADLGSGLKLPPWLEPRRREIERVLPAISTELPELASSPRWQGDTTDDR